ncbi:hypothetical protein C8R43DRAFT_1242285 [Mycena crocata]|nr:hypothetical protein C8R43DRAFT_1242285 [Mycena crocata]
MIPVRNGSPRPASAIFLTLLREFLLTVALAYITLLAVLQTVQYHVRFFLVLGNCAGSPPSSAEASASAASYTSSAASSSPTSIQSVLAQSPTSISSCIPFNCTPISAARISRQIATLSPLAVLKITTVCAVLVFIGLEVGAWAARSMQWMGVPLTLSYFYFGLEEDISGQIAL